MMDEIFDRLEIIFEKSFISLESLLDNLPMSHDLAVTNSNLLPDRQAAGSVCLVKQDPTYKKYEEEHGHANKLIKDCEEVRPDFNCKDNTKTVKTNLCSPSGIEVDEFGSCFDGIVYKSYDVEMSVSDTRSKLQVSGLRITEARQKRTKNVCAGLDTSENSLIENFFENRLLDFRRLSNTAGRKTNRANVFLRSRHLVDLPESERSLRSRSLPDQSTKKLFKGTCSSPDNVFDGVSNEARIMPNNTAKHVNDEEQVVARISSERLNTKSDILDVIGYSLAHGKEQEMAFAVDIVKKQLTASDKDWKEFSIMLDVIALQTVVGPPSSDTCVLEGIVVTLSKPNETILQSDSQQPRCIMLINGDITYNYRHAGMKTPVKTIHVIGKKDFADAGFSEQRKWISKVSLAVKDLNVGVVACRGDVDDDLRNCLQELHVIVLEGLNHRQLKILSMMTKTSVVSYPSDFVASDLGEPVVVKLWVSGWSSGKRLVKHFAKARDVKKIAFAQISRWIGEDSTVTTGQLVQTLMLCAPVLDLVGDSELKFWNCVHRLRNAFLDQRVLTGAGEIERLCVTHLKDMKDYSLDSRSAFSFCSWALEDCMTFRPVIYDAFIKGLEEFMSRVEMNAANGRVDAILLNSSESPVAGSCICTLDNYLCKKEAWRRAIRVVKLLICSEYQIVTGI